jgi:hypothetical protein
MGPSSYPSQQRTPNNGPAVSSRLMLQRLQAKQQIIAELIAGKLELFEAASRFQAVHAVAAACFDSPAVSTSRVDSENVCRTVIGWVHLALAHRPEEAERVSSRLERELEGYINRFGSVRLPATC